MPLSLSKKREDKGKGKGSADSSSKAQGSRYKKSIFSAGRGGEKLTQPFFL